MCVCVCVCVWERESEREREREMNWLKQNYYKSMMENESSSKIWKQMEYNRREIRSLAAQETPLKALEAWHSK
jgi:hypothetical protein